MMQFENASGNFYQNSFFFETVRNYAKARTEERRIGKMTFGNILGTQDQLVLGGLMGMALIDVIFPGMIFAYFFFKRIHDGG